MADQGLQEIVKQQQMVSTRSNRWRLNTAGNITEVYGGSNIVGLLVQPAGTERLGAAVRKNGW